jgi:RNA polymerase sigma-70 factor (ECF subfamily)
VSEALRPVGWGQPVSPELQTTREGLLRFAARYVSDPDDREDLVQDVLLHAARYPHSYEGPHQRGRLAKRLRQQLWVWMTRGKRPGSDPRVQSLDERVYGDETDTLTDTLVDPGPSPERQVVATDDLRAVLDQLDRLDPADVEVLRLHRIEGLTLVEIAAAMGVSRARAGQRVARATRQLCEREAEAAS